MRILIIRLSSFGDIIHTLPVLTRLRALYPDAELSWLVSHKFSNLLTKHPDINDLYIWQDSFRENINLLKELRSSDFDYVLDLQGLIKTALMGCFISKNNLYGLAPTREIPAQWLYKHKLHSPDELIHSTQHVIDRSLKIIDLLEPSSHHADIKYNLPVYPIPDKYPELQESNYIIASTQTRWDSKSWNKWSQLLPVLAQKLQEHNLKLVLLGIDKEEYNIKNNNFINLTGKTSFTDLKAIVANAQLMLGLDSGILHLAEAYNIKTIGLYGSTSAIRTGNYSGISINNNLQCSPCHKRTCPLAHSQSMQCMNSITTEQVLNEILSVLSNLNNL